MAQYERSSLNPAGPGSDNPVSGLAAMHSFAHSAMRTNLEVLTLASRRSRAHLDLPKQVLACRNAEEFGQIGAQFWRDAFQDYVHCNQRLLGMWMQGMNALGQGNLARAAFDNANRYMQPMAEATRSLEPETVEPEPWAWWRTDMKGLKPSRNGHSRDEGGARAGY